ncbi:hypothetical protein HH308_06235 [Gordonia sp. TBRC 11910]|uniref:Uncharacterized protein n=1 Tax=Gordonia asplenii TaxID=2725283 RepID=A0A848KR11_9ACTN|nr:hypothetical protein [Gordonia asplenii]NMO00810.1 hypothetical protein [Gordonia asplenii]
MPLSPFELGELAAAYSNRQTPLDQSEVDVMRLLIHLDEIAAPAMNPQIMATIVIHALTCPSPGESCVAYKCWQFETALVRLAGTATLAQRAHLAAGYPVLMAMVEMYQDEEQRARLHRIAYGAEKL